MVPGVDTLGVIYYIYAHLVGIIGGWYTIYGNTHNADNQIHSAPPEDMG